MDSLDFDDYVHRILPDLDGFIEKAEERANAYRADWLPDSVVETYEKLASLATQLKQELNNSGWES